ncbi:uncharacterized protein LOC144345904 [Saccoglossus kowalevskii]
MAVAGFDRTPHKGDWSVEELKKLSVTIHAISMEHDVPFYNFIEKPLGILTQLISRFSPDDSMVLDLCSGTDAALSHVAYVPSHAWAVLPQKLHPVHKE